MYVRGGSTDFRMEGQKERCACAPENHTHYYKIILNTNSFLHSDSYTTSYKSSVSEMLVSFFNLKHAKSLIV